MQPRLTGSLAPPRDSNSANTGIDPVERRLVSYSDFEKRFCSPLGMDIARTKAELFRSQSFPAVTYNCTRSVAAHLGNFER